MENFSMMDFNYFDVIISAIVLILGIRGFMQGFIQESFGLAGLVGGVYFGSRLAPEAAKFIDKEIFHLENNSLLTLLGFLAILVLVWAGAAILGAIFSKLSSKSGLGLLDRILGFIIGGGKYFVIFALIVTALSNVTVVKNYLAPHVKDSILYPLLTQAGTYLIHLDPEMLGFTKSPDKSPKTSATHENNTTNESNNTHTVDANTTLTH